MFDRNVLCLIPLRRLCENLIKIRLHISVSERKTEISSD